LNQFGILAGGGLDYDINSNLYLRCQVMLQVRLVDKDVSDFVEEAKKHVDKNETVSTSLGIGPVFKVGIGFRF
jgi:outer membrane protein W